MNKIVFSVFRILALCCGIIVLSRYFANAFYADHKIWPAAAVELYSNDTTNILRTVQFGPNCSNWDFEIVHFHGDREILAQACARFRAALCDPARWPRHASDYPVNPSHATLWDLVGVRVAVTTNDTLLHHAVDESYALEVRPVVDNDAYVILTAATVYGALHGMQTLLQLLDFAWLHQDGESPVYVIRHAPLQIMDAPVYPFRGLLIDTARHYLPLELILRNLDVMAMNKLNVLHWHVTDSQSWPFQSTTFPNLTRGGGAYCADCVYTVDDMQRVQKEAVWRGIRVVPEIDLPGHAQSLQATMAHLLTDCGPTYGPREPLDVTRPSVYDFVGQLYLELTDVFLLSDWIHVGGDEVDTSCWCNNTAIQNWMHLHGMTDETQLQDYFESFLLRRVLALDKRPVVWQEVFDSAYANNATHLLPPNVVVDIWKDWDDNNTRGNATQLGYDVVYSACWYLDHLGLTFEHLYQCDPRNFTGATQHVVGGHASMWGERVDAANFMPRVWPRASAPAEALWSGRADATTLASYTQRIERFRCLMLRQGVPAEPIGPGSCDKWWPSTALPVDLRAYADPS